jgi:hypothetical protein
VQSPAQEAVDNSPWKEYTDKATEKKYYFNTDSKETTWEVPEDYKVLLDRLSAEIKANLMQNENMQEETKQTIVEFRTKDEALTAYMVPIMGIYFFRIC